MKPAREHLLGKSIGVGTLPIVCPNMVDPVGEGFTGSLARPDRNVTGISWQSFDSISKRLQLTRELELVVNVKASRAFGITVAPGVLQAATQVIQ